MSSFSMKRGDHPKPSKNLVISSSLIREKIVGFEILNPFKSKIGKTAPSFLGFKNLIECHAVIEGPVSTSPSPITVNAIWFGLSKTAPVACDNEYPSSPPSCNEPGVCAVMCDPIPPGNEKRLNKRDIPSTS